jgi:peptidoglycan/LPS O-acetylase OafA/YrhL
MRYRKEIDGLRAVAVIPVIFFHAGIKYFEGGFIGVDIFFVISGYLITSILIQDITKNNFSLINFYDRRIRRILPALFFVMLISIPFAWLWMMPTQMEGFSRSLIASTLFLSNILFWKERNYFEIGIEEKPLIHTWSLSIEEQYYLIFPIFLFYAWYFGRKKVFWIIIIISLVSFILSEWGWRNRPMANFFLTPTRTWELLVGSLTALYLSDQKTKSNNFLSFLGLLFISMAVFFYDKNTPFPSFYTLLPITGVVLLIVYADENTFIAKLLSNKNLVKIGLISYSLYLIHQPIFAFYRISPYYKPEIIYFLPLIFIAFLIATFSWKYIEQPFRDKKKIKRKFLFNLSFIFVFIFISVGLAGVKTDGFNKLRFSSSDREFLDVLLLRNYFYVTDRFDQLKNKDWDLNIETTNVLIIGDSFAQDIVNSVYEVELNKNLSLKVKEIPASCGNLFIKYKVKEKNMSQSDRKICKRSDLFADKNFLKDLAKAEEVWLVSSWREWHLKFMKVSIKNLSKLTQAKIKVFGRKDFPSFEPKKYIGLNKMERAKYEDKVNEKSLKFNKKLASIVGNDKFIDTQKMVCEFEKPKCKVFDENGKIKTWDGAHFTRSGAKGLGEKLKTFLNYD